MWPLFKLVYFLPLLTLTTSSAFQIREIVNLTINPHSTFGHAIPYQVSSTDLRNRGKIIVAPYVTDTGVRKIVTLKNVGNPNDINSRLANGHNDEEPPPHEQVAKMARFIVAKSEWASLATISTRGGTKGFPCANIISVADGYDEIHHGTPYMYTTPLDLSSKDLKANNKASMTMSLAQETYCSEQDFDPEDPRCARVILTGHIVKMNNTSKEGEFAKTALFKRHPVMPSWPKDHGWFFAKMKIKEILVLDYFGGAVNVPLSDYFHA